MISFFSETVLFPWYCACFQRYVGVQLDVVHIL